MSELPVWIEVALTAGRRREFRLIRQMGAKSDWKAVLDFCDLGETVEAHGRTPEEAFNALDRALQEDAADEMVKKGVV